MAIEGAQAPTEERRYPSAAMGWITVVVLFILYILSLADRYIIALLVDPIKQDLGLSDFELSLLQGPAFALLYSACAIPIGVLLDRYGRRIVLYVSVTVWSIAAAACGFTHNFWQLFAARAVLGAGEAGFSTGAYSVIGDSFPPERVSLAMSIFVMGGVMGAGIVFLLGGPLVAALQAAGPADYGVFGVLEPWRQVFIITGVPGIFLAFLIFLFRETRKPVSTKDLQAKPAGLGYGEAFAFIRKHKSFYFAAFVGISTVFAVTIGLQLWTPSFLIRTHGWEPAQIGIVMGVAQILAALTLPLHGWAVDKLYQRGMKSAHMTWCIASALLGVVFGVGAYLSPNPWIGVTLFGCYMATGMAASSIGPALVQIATPARLRGRVSALFVLVTGLVAMGLGPTMVGFVTDHVLRDEAKIGWSLIIVVSLVLPAAALIYNVGRTRLDDTLADAAALARA